MDDERSRKGKRVRSFVLGSLLGASAVAGIRRGRRRRRPPLGLAAFEGPPCYRELLDETSSAGPNRDSS